MLDFYLTSDETPFSFSCSNTALLKNCNELQMNRKIHVLYVQNGSLTLLADYRTYTLSQGDLVFINSYVAYRYQSINENTSVLSFDFLPELIISFETNEINDNDARILYIQKKGAVDIFSCNDDKNLHAFFQNTLNLIKIKSYSYEYMMHAKILRLYMYIMDKWNLPVDTQHVFRTKNIKQIKDVIDCIHTDFNTVTSSELCKKFGYQDYSFSRNFRLLTGFSVSKYITRVKIEYSKFLLVSTKKSITDIALYTGYEDSSYFAKCFF